MDARHRVTVKHIRYLASGPRRHDGQRATILADTDSGIRLVIAGEVFDGRVRRALEYREHLASDADAAGLSLSEYVRQHGGRIAAGLNAILAEDG